MNAMNYPTRNNNFPGGTMVHEDAANHCDNWNYYRTPNDRITSTHEATHGINAQIRNSANGTPGYYVLKDVAYQLTEIKGTKSQAAAIVPNNLRYYRYKLYMAGQTAWDSMPSYVFDEGISYLNGAKCAVELAKIDRNSLELTMARDAGSGCICCAENYDANTVAIYGGEQPIYQSTEGDGTDFLFGPVEFIAYCTAAVMVHPTAEWDEFLIWYLDQTKKVYEEGKEYLPWPAMEECWARLAESGPIHDYLSSLTYEETNYWV